MNLKGGVMIPAFIDPHSHFTQTAYSFLQADLNGLTDINQITSKIKEFINENNIKAGEWVIARGYDNNLFDGNKIHLFVSLMTLCLTIRL